MYFSRGAEALSLKLLSLQHGVCHTVDLEMIEVLGAAEVRAQQPHRTAQPRVYDASR